MTNNSGEKNLEKIRGQIELLKKRITNMDKTLVLQEKAIDLIDEKSKALLREAQFSDINLSVEQIMKNAFNGKTLPKILLSQWADLHRFRAEMAQILIIFTILSKYTKF